MSLVAKYTKAFDDNCLLDPMSWFEYDTPQEQIDLLDNLVCSYDVAEEMIWSGQACWTHLGWWKDVRWIMERWANDGYLVKVRLVAEWLLSTHAGSLDTDILPTLTLLSQGLISDVFPNLSSRWPAKPEVYLSALQWAMFDVAEFAVMDETATIKAAMRRKGIVL